ncbi:hypothetical protein AYO20_09115 [Fonsecaea nubica]|uniref:Uncharacterized protein n=1 Tax=Fonsecaea nubica TaxID=856822 RepID=A0A178CLM2_9EURO|nr:hypothetical protein AYO20_09115 [Fonsecaea nubica]OAL29731.1 hypothetical protein AYO20_09115 [Fonsecaea nubica]
MNLPPIPPLAEDNAEVATIIEDINRRTVGDPPDTARWIEYPLSEPNWIVTNKHLAEQRGPTQYGYFCGLETFVHQIPSPAQQLFIQSFSRKLLKKLTKLCRRHRVRMFRKRILAITPPTSKAGSNACRDLHQPDAFFHHVCLPKYGVVVEISFLQKRERLQELAEFYILKSNRKVRLFVAFDYDHHRTWNVSMHTWRRDYTDPEGRKLKHHYQEIRGDDGRLVPGPPLRVCLLDFARQELIPPFLHGRSIELSVREIGAVIEEADALEEIELEELDSDGDSEDPETARDRGHLEWPFEEVGHIPYP